jgi:hypothetical protein
LRKLDTISVRLIFAVVSSTPLTSVTCLHDSANTQRIFQHKGTRAPVWKTEQ